jgi:replicative DNA helicase
MNTLDPPRDPAAEERLLACMMWGACGDAIHAITRSDFTSVAREIIFAAMIDLNRNGKPIDLVLLHDELRAIGEDVRCGGPIELARIFDTVPSGANAPHYAEIVRRLGRRRSIMRASEDLHRRAANLSTPDDELELRSIDA